jgi:hypothetical protein
MLHSRQVGEPHGRFGYRDKLAFEPIAVLVEQSFDDDDLVRRSLVVQPQQYDAAMLFVVPKHGLAEIVIARVQNAILIDRKLQHEIIVGATMFIEDRNDVVPGGFQPTGQCRAGTFVDDESHLLALYDEWKKRGAVEVLLGEQQAGFDVFALQPVVLGQNLIKRGAVLQQAENELDRQPRAADDGLAGHDRRIDCDALPQVVRFHFSHSGTGMSNPL